MFTYDAQAARLNENPCSNGAVQIALDYGGVIATTGDENTAIGIYLVNTTQEDRSTIWFSTSRGAALGRRPTRASSIPTP
jgi:hypothetical protein